MKHIVTQLPLNKPEAWTQSQQQFKVIVTAILHKNQEQVDTKVAASSICFLFKFRAGRWAGASGALASGLT